MYSIETQHLTHRFSSTETVLKNIDLQVPAGSIYGFLGPNGAGKTTTLRLLLGLLKKQEGSIRILDKQLEHHRIEILQRTGSLIESPSFYGHLTAHENLVVFQKLYQCPKKNITEMLELVGLGDTGKKLTSRFSLGMKQRLGIAIALLNDPSLLILDEPTNGLDPNGIIEIRELLKRINREKNITIIISSHLLAEIEKMVTHVGIINKGTLLFQGTLEELTGKQQHASFVNIETNDAVKTLQALRYFEIAATQKNEKFIFPVLPKKDIAKLVQYLINDGVEIYEVAIVKNDLETIFMDLIK